MEIAPGVLYREEDAAILVNGERLIPNVRRFRDLRSVLMEPERLEGDGDAYFMYRDLPPLRGSWARFDVTIIPPWRVGSEYAKTKGHYHNPPSPGKPPYPELYQVIRGEALYLMQRPGRVESEIVDFIAVRALPGDAVVIPPGYGHVTVNPGGEILLMSNIIYREVSSNYSPYERLRGAAYYYTVSGFVRNGTYSRVPDVREVAPIRGLGSIASEFLRDSGSFSWLRDVDRACEEGFMGVRC